MEQVFQQKIARKKFDFYNRYQQTLWQVAQNCVQVWKSADDLDQCLKQHLAEVPNCKMLYAIDCNGTQISSNILGSDHINPAARGQDLSARPYIQDKDQQLEFNLSKVYISNSTLKPCITALHHVLDEDDEVLGCIAADFQIDDIEDEIKSEDLTSINEYWRQIKGDPAIRQNLFLQKRINSAMDQKIEQVHSIINNLMSERGIFHAKLHYSSSRATLWPYDTPYEYKLHVLDDIINPDICLAYAKQDYPEKTKVAAEDIPKVLERFIKLRNADETLYLRAGSINVMNSLVGLNFSCDGSHYMPVSEFLEKPLSFWLG